MKEKVELKDGQLQQVNGGANKKENEDNGKINKKCEPKYYPLPVKDKNKVTYVQKPGCRDITNKGSKPECVGCEANK